MAKQTMAYSTQALQFRADQKIYHLQVSYNLPKIFHLVKFLILSHASVVKIAPHALRRGDGQSRL